MLFWSLLLKFVSEMNIISAWIGCWIHVHLGMKTANFLHFHATIREHQFTYKKCNHEHNNSPKFAGDRYSNPCSCMLISGDYSSLFKRLWFLQAFSSSPVQQIPDVYSICFHHLGFYCHIFSCDVLDFISLSLDDSGSLALQITLFQCSYYFSFL